MSKNIDKLMPDIGMLLIDSISSENAMPAEIPQHAAPDYSSFNADELDAELKKNPLNIEIHRQLFDKRHEQGDELAALAHMIAAKAIEAYNTTDAGKAEAAWQLYMVATGYFMKSDYAIAERWYQLVLMLDPNIAAVYQNMVVIHGYFGRHEEAEACRARAYQMQRVFVDPIRNPVRQLLILCVGRTKGNIPYELLLSAETSQRIKYIIDYAEDVEDSQLPPYDLVFNAIGEPDVAAPLTARLERFLKACTRPVLNHPKNVARTHRHQLPTLLAGIEHVLVAPCCRIDVPDLTLDALSDLLLKEHIWFPVLVRPTETHGGQGMVFCASPEAVLAQLQTQRAAYYVNSFVDFKSADGFYRKYRIVYVDKQPYPYHLAISPQWMVHYQTAEMLHNPWKIAEEHLFLQDPAKVLGEKGMSAIVQIGQRLNLDYAGIDFTILPDGQLFIFEANATMLVHRVNSEGVLAHKNAYILRIADAFEKMQQLFD